MRLTWRDGATTVLATAGALAVVALMQEWGWPMLGSIRAGVVAVGVVGMAMCRFGARFEGASWTSPYMVVASLLGVAALALGILGLVTGSQAVLVALAMTMLALWAASTARHALARGGAPPRS